MRSVIWMLLAIALAACGGGSSTAPQQPQDPGTPPQGNQRFTVSVTLAGSGSGSVRSSDAAVNCPGACSQTANAGTAVHLEAMPAAGSHFAGWAGACAGSSACDVTLGADASVTATFDKDGAPPPGKHRLTVTINGQGSVKSDPAGIDCGSVCVAVFDSSALVRLAPTAAEGFAFAGWGGGCSGSGPCGTMMNADTQVWATFEKVAPPPPADECDGLMPATVPAPVDVAIAGEYCVRGLSDDGDGNYLLYTAKPNTPGGQAFHFFQVRNGVAADTGNTAFGPTLGGSGVYSQPAGFSSVDELGGGGGGGFVSVRSFSPEGRQTGNSPTLAHPGQWNRISLDPSGGFAFVKQDDNSPSLLYTRLDKTGATVVKDVPVDVAGRVALSIGVDLAGNVLLLAINGGVGPGTQPLFGRWLNSMGAPVTDWFAAGDTYIKNPGLVLVYEGLALRDNGGGFMKLFRDAQPTAEAAPAWMNDQGRGSNLFALVRRGKAYASWSGGPCGDGLEMLAKSGKSCGCIAQTRMNAIGTSNNNSVGRDGSVMVGQSEAPPDPNAAKCTFHIWPQLLR